MNLAYSFDEAGVVFGRLKRENYDFSNVDFTINIR